MQSHELALTRLSDAELLAEVKLLAANEREATAALIASLAEVDARRLYLGAGYSSMFTYCVHALRLSEDAAYFRIEAARAARRFPLILQRLASGASTLTTVKLLAPHLTEVNHAALLDEASGKTRREVERIVARIAPRPDAPSVIRKLPAARPNVPLAGGQSASAPNTTCVGSATDRPSTTMTARPVPCPDERLLGTVESGGSLFTRAVATEPAAAQSRPDGSACALPACTTTAARRAALIAPLAPERYKIQITVGEETHRKIRRLQDLLRHDISNGDPAAIIDRALTLLLEQTERRRCATKRVRSRSAKRAGGRSTASDHQAGTVTAAAGKGISRRATGDSRWAPGATGVGDTNCAGPLANQCASGERSHEEAAGGLHEPGSERVDAGGQSRVKPSTNELGTERVQVNDEKQAHGADRGAPKLRRTACAHAARSRYIPVAVRREVWLRDGGRCTYVGTDGRCGETGLLEYHHVIPYANGGETAVANVRLACRRHNQWEAERFFGVTRPLGDDGTG